MTPKTHMTRACPGRAVRALMQRRIGAALLALAMMGMALGPVSALAQDTDSPPEPQVLVSNLGVGVSGSGGIQRTLHTGRSGLARPSPRARPPAAYALASIGIQVSHLFDATIAGDHLRATVNGASDTGGPGDVLCTLSKASSLSAPGVTVFGAPTGEGSCPQLQHRGGPTSSSSSGSTPAALTGSQRFRRPFPPSIRPPATRTWTAPRDWSIADRSHYLSSGSGARTWTEFVELASFKIVVKGAALSASQANRLPTGEPHITGTAQVGETLTADTAGIEDDDGLDNVAYSYQWLAGGTPIPEATNSSHTLTEDEQGQTIQIRVSFRDDAGIAETLTSDPTEPVASRPN